MTCPKSPSQNVEELSSDQPRMSPALLFVPCGFAYNFRFPLLPAHLCPRSACSQEILLFFEKDPAVSFCLISSRGIEVKSTICTLPGGGGTTSPFKRWKNQGLERENNLSRSPPRSPGSNYRSVHGWHIIVEQYLDWAFLGYMRGGCLLPPFVSPWPVFLPLVPLEDSLCLQSGCSQSCQAHK